MVSFKQRTTALHELQLKCSALQGLGTLFLLLWTGVYI